jgi:GH24 family phage-related lysozyme (muramidase)
MMTQPKPITLTKGTVIQADCVLCDYAEAMRCINEVLGRQLTEQQEKLHRGAVYAYGLATGEVPE